MDPAEGLRNVAIIFGESKHEEVSVCSDYNADDFILVLLPIPIPLLPSLQHDRVRVRLVDVLTAERKGRRGIKLTCMLAYTPLSMYLCVLCIARFKMNARSNE